MGFHILDADPSASSLLLSSLLLWSLSLPTSKPCPFVSLDSSLYCVLNPFSATLPGSHPQLQHHQWLCYVHGLSLPSPITSLTLCFPLPSSPTIFASHPHQPFGTKSYAFLCCCDYLFMLNFMLSYCKPCICLWLFPVSYFSTLTLSNHRIHHIQLFVCLAPAAVPEEM